MILSGKKNITWRINDDKNTQIGDVISFINWNTGKVFGKGKVTGISEKEMGKITGHDLDGHEEFKNREEMVATYKKYYGNWVNDSTLVKMIKFELLKGKNA